MQHLTSVNALRECVGRWRGAGETVALVPTMGNLHAGHLRLVEEARGFVGRVVVSLFVNPLQFGPGEDFGAYPRTPDDDAKALGALGTDLVFEPPVDVMYPVEASSHTRVEVPGLSDILCGESRPGHFAGVTTVVCKLLNLVQPQVAVFGEKDFQQLLLIRRMVADLAMPVRIVGVPTVRESDGLAMSSRNGYLTDPERQRAPRLHAVLRELGQRVEVGATDLEALQQQGAAHLEHAGFRPDYLRILRADDLAPATTGDRDLVILAAAYLGRARLIDNLRVTRVVESG